MTLVTNGANGYPHAVAMFYSLDPTLGHDLTIRFATYASSQKVKNIERDPKVTVLVETGTAYSELRGVMIQGRARIENDLERIVATMIEANAGTGSPLPDIEQIPHDVKVRMAGKRVSSVSSRSLRLLGSRQVPEQQDARGASRWASRT